MTEMTLPGSDGIGDRYYVWLRPVFYSACDPPMFQRSCRASGRGNGAWF